MRCATNAGSCIDNEPINESINDCESFPLHTKCKIIQATSAVEHLSSPLCMLLLLLLLVLLLPLLLLLLLSIFFLNDNSRFVDDRRHHLFLCLFHSLAMQRLKRLSLLLNVTRKKSTKCRKFCSKQHTVSPSSVSAESSSKQFPHCLVNGWCETFVLSESWIVIAYCNIPHLYTT
jgi:hypothetical protein